MPPSVAMPVFNAAPWPEECLASIEGQMVGTLEVICVDGGSTDNSPLFSKTPTCVGITFRPLSRSGSV